MKICPEADPGTKSIDCVLICEDVDAMNEATGCFEAFDELYDCLDLRGVCAEGSRECATFSAAYDDCVAEHCSRDSERDDCGL